MIVIKGDSDDPHLPLAQLDAALILNSYHEMPRYAEMLRHIRDSLKPGGRLLIAEPRPKPGELTRAQQIEKHHISPDFVASEVESSGFSVGDRRDAFAQTPDGSTYSLVVARVPGL